MIIKKEVNDFYTLKENSWSGALYTLNKIEEEGKEDDLMALLDEIFYDGADETQVNDFLWFDDEYIFEMLGIKEEEEEEEGEE